MDFRLETYFPIFLYLLAILASAIGLALKNGASYLFLAPPVYWAIHFGLGYGFWIEAISRLRKLRRQPQRADRNTAETPS